MFVSEKTSIGVIPVTLGEQIQDDNYRGELDPVNVHLPIFMGIWFALNEQIFAYEYRIQSNSESIRNWEYLKSDEEDSFFFFRDDDKIRSLAERIKDTEEENTNMQRLIDIMKQDSEKFKEYMKQIMCFINGKWLM